MHSEQYADLLEDYFITFVKETQKERAIYRHNATIHTSKNDSPVVLTKGFTIYRQ